jgi:hypothetical protein
MLGPYITNPLQQGAQIFTQLAFVIAYPYIFIGWLNIKKSLRNESLAKNLNLILKQ